MPTALLVALTLWGHAVPNITQHNLPKIINIKLPPPDFVINKKKLEDSVLNRHIEGNRRIIPLAYLNNILQEFLEYTISGVLRVSTRGVKKI